MSGVKSVFLVVGSDFFLARVRKYSLKGTFFLPSTSFEDGLQTIKKILKRNAVRN